MNYAWPAALAFASMCAAIAYGTVYSPPGPKSAQIVCIEQRGKWVGSGWGPGHGTCEFSPNVASPK